MKLLRISLRTSRVIPLLLLLAASASAEPKPVHYTVSFVNPGQHLAEVQIDLPPGASTRDLQLPVWNALYQIRDFSQFVNWIHAQDRAGHQIPVRQVDDSRWRISGAEQGVIVRYQTYFDSPGPFGAQLNSHHAFLNLAELLIYSVDARGSPMLVRFNQVPSGWKIATPLNVTSNGEFRADNYDRLVDSPVEMGTFQESDFDQSGAHYRVVIDAQPDDYDMSTIVSELRQIVTAATTWMNDRPFQTYTFIYHFPHGPAGGGMEHSYSTAIDLSADAIKASPAILTDVTAHEFFHLWNVKRIRPQTLEPVDYTKENFTRALWFSEGCTSTAADIIQLRAGLLDEHAFLTHLGQEITELERRPAHLTQSAEQSSLDAWLEGYAYYRQPQRSISYYNKGELLGLMLDLNLRELSHDTASLREVFQWMNQHYAKQGRYFADSDGVREAAEAVTHADMKLFFANYVAGTEEIPWDNFLRTVGLRVSAQNITVADPGFSASRNFDGPMSVASVDPSSDAQRAGLLPGDVILTIQSQPAGQDAREQMTGLTPGETLTLKVRSRRGAERELSFKVGSRQEISYEVHDLDVVTPEQRARRAAWLKGEAQPAPAVNNSK